MYYFKIKNLSLRDNNVSLRYKACVNINESFRLKSFVASSLHLIYFLQVHIRKSLRKSYLIPKKIFNEDDIYVLIKCILQTGHLFPLSRKSIARNENVAPDNQEI